MNGSRKKAKSLLLKQRQYIEASTSQVFKALTDADELVKWFVIKARFDPRKGGLVELDWPSRKHRAGKILKFELDKCLEIPWSHGTRVRFDLKPTRKGTALTLTHEGWMEDKIWSQDFIGHCVRWTYYLMNLKSWIEFGNDLRSNVYFHKP